MKTIVPVLRRTLHYILRNADSDLKLRLQPENILLLFVISTLELLSCKPTITKTIMVQVSPLPLFSLNSSSNISPSHY